jgi:hypothetical protein
MSTALLVPGHLLPEWLGGNDDLLENVGPKDKILHAGSFAVLMIVSMWSRQSWGRFPKVEGAWALLYAAATEVIQGATGWRDAEWLDLVADMAGIVVGGATGWAIPSPAPSSAPAKKA